MNTTTATEYDLGPIAQIPLGEGREFQVDGRVVAVFRSRTDGVFATQPNCPHRQAPLADGLLGGTTLQCPFHAWKFNLTTGEPILGECALLTYPVRLDEADRIILQLER